MALLGFQSNYGDASHLDKHLVFGAQICEDQLDDFFSMMIERQNVAERRMKGQPKPWTENPILRDYKFTNVYRELDRNSQWEIKNIILNDELNDLDMVFNILMYRMFNQPPFFEFCRTAMLDKWGGKALPSWEEYNKEEFERLVMTYRMIGQNPFTNAYLTNSIVCPGQTRDWCFANKIIPTIHLTASEILQKIKKGGDAFEFVKYLTKLPSVSFFMAHEFFISFCYLAKYRDDSFFSWDEMDYTNVGPGASLGIRIIFPNLDTTKKQLEAIYWLQKISKYKFAELGGFRYSKWDKKKKQYVFSDQGDITLHAIEMSLCEFQKYWKMKLGVGKQRSKFKQTVADKMPLMWEK